MGGCPARRGLEPPAAAPVQEALSCRVSHCRVPSQPFLRAPVSGTHGLAIAEPPESREMAEVGTIETGKYGTLARGAGLVPEAVGAWGRSCERFVLGFPYAFVIAKAASRLCPFVPIGCRP